MNKLKYWLTGLSIIVTLSAFAQVEAFELYTVTEMTIDRTTYTRQWNRFVAITKPAGTLMIIVSHSPSLNQVGGYGLRHLPQTDKHIAFPVPTYIERRQLDGRSELDQFFSIHTSLQLQLPPYLSARWVGNLPKRTCRDIGLKCSNKRRTVTQ